MPIPTHMVEIPQGPLRGYFAPWSVRREEDPEFVRHYERAYELHKRKSKAWKFGLSKPMLDMFRNLFLSFAMFSALAVMTLGLTYIFKQGHDFTQKKWLLDLIRIEIIALFFYNAALFIVSVARIFYKTVKAI